ncbi:MAG TPA: transcriptional regulator [Candidatus Saccharimonadales bacterium]|nr:transcriptional regulator [Candidatus Saccharimonadales bacterium]
MIEQLFGSKTRVKLLQLFYSNPNRSFYVREITRKIDEQINSVRRELANLLNIGIIVSDNTNNRLYYEVNQKFEHYLPLQQIFGQPEDGAPVAAPAKGQAAAPKATGGSGRDKLKTLGNIDLVILTGQFTRDERSGADMLIVGDINPNALQKFVAELEAQESKDIRYVHMTPQDFSYRRQIKDRFTTNVLESKKQVLLDKNNIL